MLEQEIASIIRTVLEAAENPSPYYNNLPEGFIVPSVFFPVPELDSGPSSLSSYEISYMWFIKLFDVDENSVYAKVSRVFSYIISHKNLIPLYNQDGTATGKSMRIDFPKLRKVEEGVMQLQIDWSCVRPYCEEPSNKMMDYTVAFNGTIIQDYDVTTAFQAAVITYLVDHPQTSTDTIAGEPQR